MNENRKQYLGYAYALVAGSSAALGSFYAKLSTTPATHLPNYILFYQRMHPTTFMIACIILMLLANGMVWTFFVKALQATSSSLVATVMSAGTNFALAALLGVIIFNESTSLLWWCGTFLVITGLILMTTDAKETKYQKFVKSKSE